MRIPQLVAHRGFMEHYPENSLEGLEASLRAGAPYIELDIQSTADGTLVLFHDPGLKRTTGVNGSLFELNYDQLTGFSANEPDRLDGKFGHITIPPLAGLIELLQRFPDSQAMIEIKPESLDYFGLERVIRQLLAELQPVREQCIIISFHLPALEYIRGQAIPCRIGWVLHHYDRDRQQIANRLEPDYLIGSSRILTPDTPLWPGDWQWMVYDITEPELALAYAEAGIELVETRDIGAMLQHPLLSQRRRAY